MPRVRVIYAVVFFGRGRPCVRLACRCELQDLRKKVQLQEESLHMEQERSFSLQRELDTERLKSQSQETDAKLERERSASLQKELSEVKENYRLLHEEMRGRLRKTAELVDEVATQVHNTRRVVSPQHAYRHNRRTRKLLKFIMDMDSTSESEDGFVAPVPGSQGQRDGMEGQGSGQPSVQRRLEESSG
ncbi:hypothetical protein Vretimale_6111 [Volvox reticuliferus]|uniref:Uncharacterized protein n=1 Tax=Volvox reticuliferus TaxID=1737510 RepID=A0A8J4G6V7_9CHLO|nr:hypothetical protein Vretifemale_7933 [Volvox reticuliferus]GIM01305.1 hypothetical protein Vretimale_6111 [Volvox reticuliferus]